MLCTQQQDQIVAGALEQASSLHARSQNLLLAGLGVAGMVATPATMHILIRPKLWCMYRCQAPGACQGSPLDRIHSNHTQRSSRANGSGSVQVPRQGIVPLHLGRSFSLHDSPGAVSIPSVYRYTNWLIQQQL